MQEHTEKRFQQLVFAILIFGPLTASLLLANWLQQIIPGLPTLLEYLLFSIPSLAIVAILYAFKPQVMAWFRKIDNKKQASD
jgi:hypothetical protein